MGLSGAEIRMELNMKMSFKLAALVAAISAVTGCATQNMKAVEENQVIQDKASTDIAERARAMVPMNPLFSKQGTFWVDRTPLPIALDPSSQLPPLFRREMSFNAQAQLPLSEILARLNKSTGVMFTVAQDVYESDPSQAGRNLSAGRGAAQTDSTSARPGAPVPAAATAALAGVSGGNTSRRVDVMVSDLIFNGNFASLLDVIATKTNLAWRFDGERVQFFRYDTRIFRIEALAGGAKSSAKISSNANGSTTSDSGSSSNTSSNQETSMDTFADIWADVSTSVQAMLSPRGKMSLLPSTGQVTVTDTPDQLRRVDTYVKDLNKSLSKQVSFNIDVYAVETKDGDKYGVDWNAVWNTVAGKYGLGYAAVGNTAGVGNLFSVNILNGRASGSSALFGALSSIGRTSLVTSTSLVTLNYIPVPVAVTRETAYLKEQTTTVAGTSGTAQTSLKAGLITTGFNMNLTPRLSDTDKMMLQFSMDLSDLIDITTFTAPDGKAAIQLPQRNVRNFLQRVSIKSGQTLVLSGFQQARSDGKGQGIGNAKNWMAGGTRQADAATTTLVVVITPYVMN